MLIQFTVENHRSIKNSTVISFAASKDKSFDEYLLRPDEKKALLPVLAIYGANAAGKSNVLHAMMTMKEMVVGNAAKVSKGQKLPWEPFGGTNVPTSYVMVFIILGVTALITNVTVQKSTLKYEMPFMMAITVVMLICGMTGGTVTFPEGVVLWALFITYLGYLFVIA